MVDPVYYLDYTDSVKSNLSHGAANSMCIVKIVFIPMKCLEKFTFLAVLLYKCVVFFCRLFFLLDFVIHSHCF